MITSLIVASLLATATAPAAAESVSDDAEREPAVVQPCVVLDRAIPYAIELLEKDKVETLLKTLARPDQLARYLKSSSMEELTQSFSKRKSGGLLKRLRALRGVAATMSQEGQVATYPLPKSFGAGKTIVFTRIDGCWYLDN